MTSAEFGTHTFTEPNLQRDPARHCACELHTRKHRFVPFASIQTVPAAHFTVASHVEPSATCGNGATMHIDRAVSHVMPTAQATPVPQVCEQYRPVFCGSLMHSRPAH